MRADAPGTTTAAVTARLQLLGEPRLLLAAGDAHPLERKDAALLALLVIDGPTARAKAAALLWPEVDDEAARNNLRQRLHRLRKRAGRDIAVTASDVLRLAEDVAHDLAALPERLTEEATAAAGELLGTFDYDDCTELAEWVAIAREQWRVARRNALAEIASRLEAEGSIALALQYAERLVADDPLVEHAHRRLMRLHYLRGDRAAALAAYGRCRQVLDQHLKAQPAHETLELARLIEASGALPQPAPAPRPVAVLRPPRLVGRDTEWRLLEQAWREGRVALVLGEPGIGKTRLLADFAAAHPGTLVTGSRPGDARVPYASLARLLRAGLRERAAPLPAWAAAELARLLPELGAAATEPLEPVRLQRALAHWQAAGCAAFVVDDLHFADDASLEALLALAGAEQGARWLFGVRAAEAPAALEGWRARCDPHAVLEVPLGPLDAAAIEALLDSLALPGIEPRAWADVLARHTGGNPLFILETLNALLAQAPRDLTGKLAHLPAPGSVGQLIERRLAQLSPAAARLARVAAIAGQDFGAELAAGVLGTHALDLAEAWRELEAAQVLRENGFAHDLIFEATLRSVPAPIARLLQRDIAAYLQAHGGAAARIALHWDGAGEPARAAEQYARAAAEARLASRRSEELALLDHAQRCYAAADSRAGQFDCLRRAFAAALHVGSMRQAEELIERMRALAQDDRQRAAVLVAAARVANTLARERQALAAATEAAALAARVGEAPLSLAAARERASALSKLDRHDQALATLEAQRHLLAALPPGEDVFGFQADYAYLLVYADRPRAAVAEYERVYEAALAAGDLASAHTVLTDCAVALMALGELRRSTAAYERARALRERLGEGRGWSLMDDMALAGNYRELGRYREALAMTLAALDGLRAAGFDTWAYQTEHDLAILYAQLGQPARGSQLLRDLPADAVPAMRITRLAARAKLARWAGQPSAALWQQARALFARSNLGRPAVRLMIELGWLRELDGAAAAPRIAALRDEARAIEQVAVERCALVYEAEALARAGDVQAAAARAREIVAIYDDWEPNNIYPPEAWLIAAQAFEAAGEAHAAAAAAARGAAWVQRTALPNVPDEFRDSFLNRNPVNRALLAAAARQARAGVR
jgi:DNA-binding SARP family transcriptional activator